MFKRPRRDPEPAHVTWGFIAGLHGFLLQGRVQWWQAEQDNCMAQQLRALSFRSFTGNIPFQCPVANVVFLILYYISKEDRQNCIRLRTHKNWIYPCIRDTHTLSLLPCCMVARALKLTFDSPLGIGIACVCPLCS